VERFDVGVAAAVTVGRVGYGRSGAQLKSKPNRSSALLKKSLSGLMNLASSPRGSGLAFELVT
jgi:hypothetical protein